MLLVFVYIILKRVYVMYNITNTLYHESIDVYLLYRDLANMIGN